MKTLRLALFSLLAVGICTIANAEFKANGPKMGAELIDVELPPAYHLKNRGGSDGVGLCVFASLTHAGIFHDEPVGAHMFQFMFTRPGGGYPEKVDQMIAACAREMGKPVPDYVQHTGGDVEFLKLALKTGRYPCVTYAGRDNVFYSQSISHMVNLVHLSATEAVIHDNNYPGKWLWMSPAEFEQRWKSGGGGWAVVFLSPGKAPDLKAPAEHFVAANVDMNQIMVGQCVNGVCYPTQPPAEQIQQVAAVEAKPVWVAGKDGHFDRYLGNKLIGHWNPDGSGYSELQADGSWKSQPLPEPLPHGQGAVIHDKVLSYGTKFTRKGSPCSRFEAFTALVEGNLTDDSKLLRVVVVADQAARDKFKAAWLTDKFAPYRAKFLLQCYDATEWQAADYKTGVTVVEPGPMPARQGKVVGQTGDLDLDLLLRLLDSILNPQPPGPGPSPTPDKPHSLAWVILAALVALIISQRKKNQPKGQ